MEHTVFADDAAVQRRVRIVGSELVDNYTVYIIEVIVGCHQWTIKHRYSDFHDLHEKLTAEKKIDKNLLPPKKMIGKNSKSLVEKRQKELEVYLETLLVKFPFAAPKVLSCFLHFHLYEINGITAALAEELFHKGEQLLIAGEVFLLRPLQLYAITQQLRLATPTCLNGDTKADLGHILDFTCRLKYLKIPGTRGKVGTSNIQELLLPFDLSVFKSLLQIEISYCESQQIKGLPCLKPTLATMSIHYCAASMKDILVPEASEFAQWEAEGMASDCPVTAVIPTWKMLTTLDMSHNNLKCIDESVKLIPKVEFLDLSYNDLTLVENLQHLYNLIHLDLSYNKLTTLEGVHTKLGNIKTLNLAGNQLESLSGLSKLYSLVNLDLSCNRLAQLEEIKNIGSLPCLEKLSLTNNPMCIIPDYRTKVLAQFWDRASEVCLDRMPTTEKELDTVEVLKAIQKAKEAKDRMANSEKKSSDLAQNSRAAAGGTPTSSSSYLLAAPPPSSPQPTLTSSSQEIICQEETNQIVTPVDFSNTQRCNFIHHSSCEETLQITQPLPSCLSLKITTDQQFSCCGCAEDQSAWPDTHSLSVLPSALVSYTAASLEFTAELSALVGKAARELDKEVSSERDGPSVQGAEPCSLGSGDGYFEVGQGSGGTLQAEGPQALPEGPSPEAVCIIKVAWALAVRVGSCTGHMLACIVLTEPWLAVFRVRSGEQPLSLADLVTNMDVELLVPYADIEAVQLDVPDVCLSVKIRSSSVTVYLLSDSQSLTEIHAHLSTLVTGSPPEPQVVTARQALLIRQLLNPWEFEANDSVVKGAFLAHLLHAAKVTSEGHLGSDMLSQVLISGATEGSSSLPCVLFLTPRHLCILRLDFGTLAGGPRSSMKLSRVPLASVLLHPRQTCHGSCPLPELGFREGHVLELLAGRMLITAVFLLPHDKFLFLSLFSQLRSGLKDIKTVVFLQTKHCRRISRSHQTPVERSQRGAPVSSDLPAMQRQHLNLSLLHPDGGLTRKLSEENQCPLHLSLSPCLRFLSGRKGDELLDFFHSSIAEVENEELAHVLWSSVQFYQSPDLELTACIMLSTKALYFILDDSAAALSDQAVLWNWQPTENKETDFIISYCFTMKLQDLQSVNVGLFDQYFRVVGPSPSHVIACLTRDSYGTHHFLQQLMAVLSSLEKLPSPEPSEQDFYSQFGKTNTGKMKNYELVHSSKVKFIYPSEEEIGDLTFIVAERKSTCAHSRAFNILLYILAFQVQSSYPGAGITSGAASEHHLQPKTLILTSTDIFLLDEDYISYPLPDFAKEPPQRDKYRLTDARRIRDLDRVLMGYQTYPQALTLVFDDVPGPDLLCHLTVDHFAETGGGARSSRPIVDQSEVQWCVFVPGADTRERLISLLARQWEVLCSRELPVELTG
ncbi:nischarin isoform X1 [Arapaima gigas]